MNDASPPAVSADAPHHTDYTPDMEPQHLRSGMLQGHRSRRSMACRGDPHTPTERSGRPCTQVPWFHCPPTVFPAAASSNFRRGKPSPRFRPGSGLTFPLLARALAAAAPQRPRLCSSGPRPSGRFKFSLRQSRAAHSLMATRHAHSAPLPRPVKFDFREVPRPKPPPSVL
jgi:hypothetical protein